MADDRDDIASVLDAYRTAAASAAAAPALTFYEGRAKLAALSYPELLARIDAVALQLRANYAVAAGDRVALLSANRIEVPVVMLALWSLGATVVPLNPTSPPSDWAYAVHHAHARGIIVSPGLSNDAPPPGAAPGFVCAITELAASPSVSPATPSDDVSFADVPAIILYTSGTTGVPKGVVLSQRNLVVNARSMAQNFGLDRTTQLAVLPLYHAHALGFGLMSALVSGGHLVFTERLDPFAWAEVIRSEKVKITSVVPTLLPALLAARATRERAPTLDAILVSSAPLSITLARDFETQTGFRLVQGWGLSEYTNFACCLSPFDTPEDHARLLLDGDLPSIGAALTGVEVRVVGPNDNELGEGTRGELQIRGPSRMIGYFENDEATRNATAEGGWLRTGDEGMFRVDRGERVYFVTGRMKEIIIRGAEKYSPLAIERRLLEPMPELAGRLVVLGFPHDVQGEEVGCYVEGNMDESMRSRFANALASLSVEQRPKVVCYGAEPIPRTHTGKVQRRKLLPLFAPYAKHRGLVRFEPILRSRAKRRC